MARTDSAPSFRERLVRAWYQPHLTLLSAVLTPPSWLYRGIVAVRRGLYRSGLLRSASLAVPVVIVGNVTVGGTGKTPLVAWLVRALRKHGLRPAIVSRGHGGANATPRAVRTGDDPREVGDESLLLARTGLPVWIGRDRVAAVQGLLAAHPEVDVIVSDDGLQHYRLPRRVEIVVVDGQRGFGNEAMLPAGPLREPVARVEEVDAIVVNGPPSNPAAVIAQHVPVYSMRLNGDRFVNLVDRTRSVGANAFAGLRVHAIAGIGNPERFFSSLKALGLDPLCRAFPDHHVYSAADLELRDAEAIVMTDKDAIKCQTLADARMWTLPVEATVSPGLIERILEKIHGREAA